MRMGMGMGIGMGMSKGIVAGFAMIVIAIPVHAQNKSVDRAVAAWKNVRAISGSFEQTLLPGARKFQELGAKGAKELTEPAASETQPRDVLKRA